VNNTANSRDEVAAAVPSRTLLQRSTLEINEVKPPNTSAVKRTLSIKDETASEGNTEYRMQDSSRDDLNEVTDLAQRSPQNIQ